MKEEFIKIPYGETFKEDFNIKEKTVSKIYENYIKSIDDYSDDLKHCIEGCESPIEQLLKIELQKLNLISTIKFNPYIDVVDIINQETIECGKKKYRVDFLIPVIYKNQENICFIVECDGYEFHQKSKEQVKKDNERTRNLQKQGYEIIRFSGSEIWKNVNECALEIKRIIFSRCKYIDSRK